MVFGKTGTVAVDLSTVAGGTGGFVINGQSAGNQSGKSVSGIGDINGDGLADLLVGAPLNGTSSPGAGYVVYGKANTTAVNLSAVAAGTGGFALFGQSAGDNAGGAVSAAGDVNGDGYADFLVNAPYNDANALADAGRSYVGFGKAGMTNVNLSSLSTGTSTSGFVINGQAASDLAGYTLSNAGDVNGDGLADILIGAYSNDVGTIVDAGRTYIVFGKTSATAINLSDLTAGTSTAGFVINGQCSNDRVGFSVSNAGDVNGDGLADIVIGASGVDTAAGTDAGRSYVVFGKTSGTAVDVTALAAGNGGYIINGQAASEYSGSAVSYAGDINGDGLADLLIATGWSDPEAGTDAGRTYVVYGQSGTSAINLSAVAAGTGGFVINGQGVSDFSGYSVSNAGDVNGDGYADLIVGARYSDPTAGTDAGRSYVIFGGSRFVSGAMATGTGTSASELVIGTSGADTLTGNGGTDRFSAGAGNDTIVLTSSDLTNLASTTASALVSTVDGGEGYDTLRLTGGASLNLSGISNASAVNNDGSSRINSIERIDMATDTAANTLTLTVEDVHDTSPLMNQIRLGGSTSTNNDGRVWTNVSGTALSATTSFHQLVVDGTASDTLVLKPDAGFWGLKGVVSNGSAQYNVYQNSLTQSQVIVAQGVVVDNQDPVTNVSVNQTFETALTSTLVGTANSNGGKNVYTVSDPDNEFSVYSGSGTNAYWHIDSTAVSAGSRVTDFTASFKYFLSSTSGDGLNFSLGDKSSLILNENGYLTGLSVKLNHLTAGSGSYYLYWNGAQVAVSSGAASYNTVHTFGISVSSAGLVTVTSDGATAISSTIAGWSTANMAGWEFGIGGRTGGNSGSAWVDDLLINATRAVAPVVLDLNRDGTFSYTHTLMDVTSDGLVDFTAWAAAPDGVLVWNKYGDGLVHDASQYAFSQYGGVSDLAGLAAGFDSNHDGVLDANDAKFAEFMVWQDINGNGVSDAGEVKSLADWDMASINLRSDGSRATPADGVTEVGHTSATLADGTSMRVADAAFDYHTATAEEQASHALAQGDTVFKLSMGQVLDLSAVTGAHALTEVDASADAAANTIRLTLADLLATPSTQAHTLKLTGDSNDTVVLDLSEGTHSDTTVTENGHTYAVYNPHAMMADQLLIDQHMLVTQNG